MFGPSSCEATADGYLRAFEKNRTLRTSPLIDVPKVRLEAAERAEEGGHHLLAIGAIGQRAKLAVGRLIELDALAVAERDRREGEVGVREDVVDVLRRAGNRPRVGEQLLFRVGQGVRGAAEDV